MPDQTTSPQSNSTSSGINKSISSCQWLTNFMKRRRHGSSRIKNKRNTANQHPPSSKVSWRIRAEDTPSAEDWWEVEKQTNIEAGNGLKEEGENNCDDGGGKNDDSGREESSGNRKFKNVGLENWEESRKQWRVRLVADVDSKFGKKDAIKPSDRARIEKGLRQVQRTFEMPVKISLPDLIKIYQDIWYSDAD